MKCIALVVMMVLAAANADVLLPGFIGAPAPLYYGGAYQPNWLGSFKTVKIEDGIKTKIAYDTPLAYSIPAAYSAAYPAAYPYARSFYPYVPAPIAVGVPKATYTAKNLGVTHTAELPGHFESVVVENNDEAPKL